MVGDVRQRVIIKVVGRWMTMNKDWMFAVARLLQAMGVAAITASWINNDELSAVLGSIFVVGGAITEYLSR